MREEWEESTCNQPKKGVESVASTSKEVEELLEDEGFPFEKANEDWGVVEEDWCELWGTDSL